MTDVSLASLALRLALSMGVVIGLMFVAAKVLRRAQAFAYGNGTGRTDATAKGGKGAKGWRNRRDAAGARRRARVTTIPIAVTTIAPLTRSASVAIVRASGRELVLGVTETHVTLLHSSIDAHDDQAPEHPDIDLDDELEALTRRTAGLDADDLEATELEAVTSSPTSAAARIAAADPGTPDRVTGLPAWTDALETLRAMTVRR